MIAAGIDDALTALRAPGTALPDFADYVPCKPGLYAIYADSSVWQTLMLGPPPDARPLYVGKAQDSLAARDLRTHFGDGRTGWSTVRRSLAALLREPLGLSARPRDLVKPNRFANYGLAPAHDARLTTWMHEHLRLAIWVTEQRASLGDIEGAILSEWRPPLNLKEVTTPWRTQVKAARVAMAVEAEDYAAR